MRRTESFPAGQQYINVSLTVVRQTWKLTSLLNQLGRKAHLRRTKTLYDVTTLHHLVYHTSSFRSPTLETGAREPFRDVLHYKHSQLSGDKLAESRRVTYERPGYACECDILDNLLRACHQLVMRVCNRLAIGHVEDDGRGDTGF